MRESDIFTADGKVPTYLREKNGKLVRAREDGFFDHGTMAGCL